MPCIISRVQVKCVMIVSRFVYLVLTSDKRLTLDCNSIIEKQLLKAKGTLVFLNKAIQGRACISCSRKK